MKKGGEKKMNFKKVFSAFAVFVFLGAFALTSVAGVFANSKPGYAAASKPGDLTILEIVLQDDGEFDVLEAAVKRAKLVRTLSGRRQYTVFAPTDAAFVKTLDVANEVEAIDAVKTMPLKKLRSILLYHVTSGRRTSQSVIEAPKYRMLNRKFLAREKLLEAGIAQTDISAKNGVIHVINSVLLP
jgi:uncharacterized surface protein with fasciclin (FAS1) repeats